MDHYMDAFAGMASSDEAKATYLASLGRDYGEFRMGRNTTRMLNEDPKMLLFTLARYKFVAKMMTGFDTVLEIGCQEAWGLPLVAQNVKSAHGVDFYIPYIDSCCRRITESGKTTNMTFGAHDILDGPLPHNYDGVFALDVLEHIAQADEDLFIRNALRCLAPHGTLILGMPSRESQAYASEASRLGHVNCKTGPELVAFARRYFNNVGTFCMNDEVLHTGFFPMAQYLLILCSGVKAVQLI